MNKFWEECKMGRKIFALILTFAITVGVLGGCGTSAPASTASTSSSGSSTTGENVTLNFAIWDVQQEPGLRKIADKFEEKNPGIKIKINVTAWADFWTMLEAAATGGSMPDVLWMHSNQIYRYASHNMLLDLTERIKNTEKFKLSDYPDDLSQIYNVDGKQYAIPKDFDTVGLWYNKTMFDKAGVKYPDETWTWDTLYKAAKKLTGNGVYGILAPLRNQEGYYPFIYQNGGTVISKDKKKSGYSDPATVEAMKYYVRFVKEKLSPKIYGDTERAETLENGLCAMGFFGSWNIATFAKNDYMVKNFDVAVLPKGKTRATIYNGLGNAISASTKHPEEAWKFLEYLSSKEAMVEQGKLLIAIPAYKGTANDWIQANKAFHVKPFIDMLDYAVPYPASHQTTKWEDKAYETLKPSFTGEQTVQQACEITAKQMDQILASE
jgi:multiple sugar transport system substrate-binding protein